MHLRHATTDDADSLARVINAAYRVEDFFKIGDRIDAAGVRDEMARGTFLLLEDDHGLAGCVYVKVTGELGYFGLLSVDPARQGQGHGSTLLRAAEEFCRDAGCRTMEIQVVNLRTELFPTTDVTATSSAASAPSPPASGPPAPATSSSCART
jgi:N-acetylglutamate synthase-like GNAT family acetyltransferase